VHGDALPAGAVARLGTTRWRHGATIHFVAFGPEGKTLLTAGQDGTVRVWDTATGKEVRRFTRPAPAAVRPPARSGTAPGTLTVPAQRLAADLEAVAARARQEAATAAAAVAAAKVQLDNAKPGDEADAAKRKLQAAQAFEQAARARAEA